VNDKTVQYIVGMAGMTVLGVAAMVLNNGSTSEVIAVAVAGGIGFHLGSHGKEAATTTGAPANIHMSGNDISKEVK
jgi:hypothetical protein